MSPRCMLDENTTQGRTVYFVGRVLIWTLIKLERVTTVFSSSPPPPPPPSLRLYMWFLRPFTLQLRLKVRDLLYFVCAIFVRAFLCVIFTSPPCRQNVYAAPCVRSIYVCVCVCVYLCLYLFMSVCIDVCICVCMSVSMYECMYACVYVCMHSSMYVGMHFSRHVCMHEIGIYKRTGTGNVWRQKFGVWCQAVAGARTYGINSPAIPNPHQ